MHRPDERNAHALRELQTQPIPRLLLRFALPALAGMLAQGLYSVVDRIYVGNLVGPSALAALSVRQHQQRHAGQQQRRRDGLHAAQPGGAVGVRRGQGHRSSVRVTGQ